MKVMVWIVASRLFFLLLGVQNGNALAAIRVGQKLPAADLHYGFPPTKINTAPYLGWKNVLIVGLPIPGYREYEDAFLAAGVDEILVYCVNDAAVMGGWQRDQGIPSPSQTRITFMADPAGDFTKALGMELTAEGPASLGLYGRCKRFALYAEKGIVKYVVVAESEKDPAGDDYPVPTLAPALLEAIKQLKASEQVA